MKKIILGFTLLILTSALFSVNYSINENSIKFYRDAYECFENQEYGTALKKCEEAILYKKQFAENHKKILTNSLSARKVMKVGDDINLILTVLEERGEKESINIIKYYFSKKGEDYFNNSIKNMLSYIDESIEFPEAKALIGDIYLIEGEYDFAEQYYKSAIDNSKVLDIPDQKYELYLKLANISELKKDYNQMEIRLLSILTSDKVYSDKALFDAMLHTLSSNTKTSLDKFFQLYRADNFYCLNAYNKLCDYYLSQNENYKALQFSMLSVVTSFSKILDIVQSRDIEYSYIDLEQLLYAASMHQDIVKWCSQNDIWKSYNTFARVLIANDYNIVAKKMLTTLSRATPEKYWQQNAVLLLSKMN